MRRSQARPVLFGHLAPIILVVSAGCVMRTAGSEHYLGPAFVRTRSACDTGTRVTQAVSLGFVAEVGRQWGVVVGANDRVTASHQAGGGRECDGPAQNAWASPVTVPWNPGSGEWIFSPLYLRVLQDGDPVLVRRAMLGVQATVGSELTAFSAGATWRMLVQPPEDAFCAVRFESRRPMQTELGVWGGVDDALQGMERQKEGRE